MKKIKEFIIIFLLMLVYINAVIFIALTFFDTFPWILDVLILFFVVPIMLAVGLSWLGSKLLSEDKGANFMDHSIFQVLIGISLFMWLVLVIGSYTGVKDFLALKFHKEHLITHPDSLTQTQIEKAAFITLTEEKNIKWDEVGTYSKSKTQRSGETSTTLIYHYYVINIPSNSDFQIWLVDYIYYRKGRRKKPTSKLLEYPWAAGIVVQDSREKDKYQVAVDIACEQYNIPKSENIVFLKYEGEFEKMLSTYTTRSIIFFIIVNLLLVCAPTYFMTKINHKRIQ